MKHRQIIICFILLFCIKGLAQSDYAVLVEESPAGAGEIEPGVGVLVFNANETVTLTTVARPGWHFVYWLGDVSNPMANQTMLAVDGPKIIVAVFEQNEYELPGDDDDTTKGSGPESLVRRTDNISSGGFSGGVVGDSGSGNYSGNYLLLPPESVPEPQALIIMAIGAYISYRRKFLINRHHRPASAGKHRGARSPESLM